MESVSPIAVADTAGISLPVDIGSISTLAPLLYSLTSSGTGHLSGCPILGPVPTGTEAGA